MSKVLKIVLYTILIEILIVSILGYIFYLNYDKLTKSESWISNKTLKTNNINLKEIEIKNKLNIDKKDLYDWFFWKIEHKTKTFLTKSKYKKEINYKLNIFNNLNEKLLFLYLINNNVISDKYIYDFLLKNTNQNEINQYFNFLILLNKLDKDKAKNIIDNELTFINENNKEITKLYNSLQFEDLKNKLIKLEQPIYNIKLDNNLIETEDLFKNHNFTHVLNKILEKKYMDYIDFYSKELNIDKKLIISVISSEQIRFLTTYRGQAKQIIKNNKALRSFTKFSYWLGWIKVNTFKKINKWMKEYNPELYNKYFKKYDWINDVKIKEVLENNDTWILYITWLIYAIEQKWDKAWYSLKNKPWVIITLYNMGNNKKPHDNPDLWGSIIRINEKYKYYFWEIWFIYYSYLKYYIFK